MLPEPPPVPDVRDLLDFRGKTVIVTGSSGGIGRGILLRFAQAGANVVLHCHTRLEEATRLLRGLQGEGVPATLVQADLGAADGAAALLAGALERFGGAEVLVNNAAIQPTVALLDMTPGHWDDMMNATLRSVFLCTQAFARAGREGEGPRAVVNITSVEAERTAAGHSHYSAAKAAVQMYTRASALELAPSGIRVNAVAPGLIWRSGLEQDWPGGVRRWQARAPLGRLGQPEDVADACLFLA
ncbi:MAG: SDR family NAD(P)-dependent oxidoreductase, partial [Deinococcus sp.]